MLKEEEYLELLRTDLSSGKFSEILEFYRINPGDLLLSGRKKNDPVFYMRKISNRQPVDMSKDVQQGFDMAASELGYKALRSNSIFCTGDESTARGYGEVYVVFPKDGFDILWSPEIEDLYVLLDMYDAVSPEFAEDKLKKDTFYVTFPDGTEKAYHTSFDYESGDSTQALLELASIGFITPSEAYGFDRVSDIVTRYPDIFDFTREDYSREVFQDFQKWLKKYALDNEKIKSIPKKFIMYNFFMEHIPVYYRDDDLKNAIKSGNEILVRADGYVLVRLDFFKKYRDSIL